MNKRTIRFGIIGLGLMGREFASAVGRWMHLLDVDFQPEILGICDSNTDLWNWFESGFDTIKVKTTDYRELLDCSDIEAIYCAVPHNLHAQMYTDIIRAGKHLLGEKPFGIDLQSNVEILSVLNEQPHVFAACSSEFPFFPGGQRILDAIKQNEFGQIIEVEAGFLHSSDMNPEKPFNWKRDVNINGEYGCMGDLGMHVLHIPLRAGWKPANIRAFLSNIVPERPDAQGKPVACATWDNATLCCEVKTAEQHFPMVLKTYRIAPGETNTWYIHILGTRYSIKYSTRYPKSLVSMMYEKGQAQRWCEESLGYTSAYPSITGTIFEFGFSDAILQMWAAFCDELVNGRTAMQQRFYCATPSETEQHHRILSAALESHQSSQAITTML